MQRTTWPAGPNLDPATWPFGPLTPDPDADERIGQRCVSGFGSESVLWSDDEVARAIGDPIRLADALGALHRAGLVSPPRQVRVRYATRGTSRAARGVARSLRGRGARELARIVRVRVQPHALDAAHSQRRQRPVMLEPAELAFDRAARRVHVAGALVCSRARMARTPGPAGVPRVSDERLDPRRVESRNLGGRRARCYLVVVHGVRTSVVHTPGGSRLAGVDLSRRRVYDTAIIGTEKALHKGEIGWRRTP